MKRREFIALVGGAAARPFAALAQQPAKLHRVACVALGARLNELVGTNPINPVARALKQGLRDLGYTEGQDLLLEWRAAEGRAERLPEIIVAAYAAIRGHVFCTFLALLLQKRLNGLASAAGSTVEWRTLLRELDQLSQERMDSSDKDWLIRTDATPDVAAIFRPAHIALPPRATHATTQAAATAESAPTSRPPSKA